VGVISVVDLEKILSNVQVPVLHERGSSNGRPIQASPREVYRNYKDIIPRSVVAKLSAKQATGDRSKVLWKLTNALLEVGLTAGEVVVLVEGTVWNKFGEDRSRLWSDVNKAAAKIHLATSSENGHRDTRTVPWSTPLDRYLAVESHDPQWMIEGLWSDKSHGIIAGEPKTRKSYVAIDIALSVATGAKCLGCFPIVKAGPVLMIQEEISDAEMRKRLRYIAVSKGLGGKVDRGDDGISVHLPRPIPLYLRNRQQFDLSLDETFRTLHKEVVAKQISLVILDPLQLMLGTKNENNAHEVRPILYNFLQLKESTGCGIMIVHHYAKASLTNPRTGGQRMLGSQAFHGWVESALYLSKPDKYSTLVEREVRNFEPQEDFLIEYVGGEERYEVEVTEERKQPKRKPPTPFEKYCIEHPATSVKALAQRFKTSDTTIRSHVEKSLHLALRKERAKSGGRPKTVVVKAPRS
jgi:hypothetical protein